MSYYRSRKNDDLWLNRIVAVLKKHPSYGIRRLQIHFGNNGYTISEAKLRRICRAHGIYGKRKKKRWKRSGASNIPYCIQKINKANNSVWYGDFTHIPIRGTQWYLATIVDHNTRKILSWKLSERHTNTLTIDTLNTALKTNKPPHYFHSDHGSEYTSQEYRELLETNNITQSCSPVGSPWLNGIQERFYRTLKEELHLIHKLQCTTSYLEMYEIVHHTISYYNTQRIHTTLGMSPQEYAMSQSSIIEGERFVS